MTTEEKIDEFKFRYIVLTINQYFQSSKYVPKELRKDLPKLPYPCNFCIFDWKEKKAIISSKEEMLKKTFPVHQPNKVDYSFLEPYETDDHSYFLQIDKVNPSMSRLLKMYVIDHIWLAYIYKSKSGIHRMCINKNLFGTQKLIGSRDMNLHEILVDL